MSSNKTNNNDKEEESWNWGAAGMGTVLGVAIGAGLMYFFRGSNESPRCHANSHSGRNTSNNSSSTFRNRQPTCETCTVCLDVVDTVVLPCTHCFHSACIKPWLRKQSTCPTCRAVVDVKAIL